MAEKKEQKKTKRPTALKRDIRNEKRRVINKAFKSKIRTGIRRFEKSLLNEKSIEPVQTLLNEVYSLLDKGVKRGLLKLNKASRAKAKLTSRMRVKFA